MRTDYRSSTAFSEEDRNVVRRLLRVRAIAVFVIVGFIALIAVTSGPSSDEGHASGPPAASPEPGSLDPGLSALERGLIG